MLPEIDGVELLKRIKASEELQNIPVIMANAKGTEYDQIQSLDLGADDYLVKTFGIMEMVSRVSPCPTIPILNHQLPSSVQSQKELLPYGRLLCTREAVPGLIGNK